MAEMAHDVFHHHYRAIHHHSEVERAQREQVGRNAFQLEATRGEEQGERNGERHDDRAAHISEEDQQDDDHQNDAFGEVVQHRFGGVVHQFATIDKRDDFDSRWQNMIVQLVDLFM